MWFLGIKLKSSCFHRNYSINWAISLSALKMGSWQFILYSIIVLVDKSRESKYKFMVINHVIVEERSIGYNAFTLCLFNWVLLTSWGWATLLMKLGFWERKWLTALLLRSGSIRIWIQTADPNMSKCLPRWALVSPSLVKRKQGLCEQHHLLPTSGQQYRFWP